METRLEKKKKSEKKFNTKALIMQWCIPVALFLVVFSIMMNNYWNICKKEAEDAVYTELIAESTRQSYAIQGLFNQAEAAATAVAEVISSEECTDEDFERLAKVLSKVQDSTYLVAIATNAGRAHVSNGMLSDISGNDYFTVSRSTRYYITEDDGLLHEPAYIIAVPYYRKDVCEGAIYMYIAKEKVEALMPLGQYDNLSSFIICTSKGVLLDSVGEETIFAEMNQYLENFRSARLDEITYARITMRLGKGAAFACSAERKGEYKTIISVPFGISDWQYNTLVNRDYVESVIYKNWQSGRTMVMGLVVALVGFAVVVGFIVFINHMRDNEQKKDLSNKADTDLLTGLNNKIATERKIQEYIDTHPDSQGLFFLFDIDNFKKINDTMGHAFGDVVLKTLGTQLAKEFRVTDVIGRTGGDEFILFLKDLKTDEEIAKEAKRLEDFFRQFKAGEYVKYSATASIGGTVFPRDGKTYDALYKTADTALYEAKRLGKNRLVLYNKDLREVTEEDKKNLKRG